jgi:1,4-alpha-glucan branching enzyme
MPCQPACVREETTVSLKKQYLKSKALAKVTFRLPREAAPEAGNVALVGEFNDWNVYATQMKKLRNGEFTVTLELETGRSYEYRYLIDEMRWENDWDADRYARSAYGNCDNSVVDV